jgi:threonine/homoserine/homoserine lactone efflux protein
MTQTLLVFALVAFIGIATPGPCGGALLALAGSLALYRRSA